MFTPMHATSILTLNDLDKKVDQTSYNGMTGSLLYLTTSRPDIMLSICLCAYFEVDPRESHLTIVKCIFRYLTSTTRLSLWFKKFDEFSFSGLSINLRTMTSLRVTFPYYMGLDLTSKLTTCGRLPFFNHEQRTNYVYKGNAFIGKVLGVEVRVDIPSIAITT
ncbi:hypothetical protein CR513_14312, partial [Mucuna pruriens]